MSKTCALPRSTFPVRFEVKSPVHALKLAKGLIRAYKHWATDAFAVRRNKAGELEGVPTKSVKAEALCALGALYRVNTVHAKEAERFLMEAAGELNGGEKDVLTLNDKEHTRENHKLVLAMFDRAIELAKESEKESK